MNIFRKRKRLLGRIDGNKSGIVHGWAHDPDNNSRRILLDIFNNDEFVGQALANQRRNDLIAAGSATDLRIYA